MGRLYKNFLRNISNSYGWQTNKKIVVFESDDWGSIRMPSLSSFYKLEKAGVNMSGKDARRYNLNDTLASSDDLECLFEVLSSVKDRSGNNAIFTPVTIVANPDFKKIRDSGYKKYFYEPFTETLERYPGCERSFDLWKEGIENKLFIPQMHGREHLSIFAWMKALQEGEGQTILAFEEKLWGFVPDQQKYPGTDYQAAFLLGDPVELEAHKRVIKEGLDLFEKLFGYKAKYFVPPNGPFNNRLNRTLIENGVKYRSTAKVQIEPLGNGQTRKVFHYLGQKEKNGITYITRNCFFEPSQSGIDWLDNCLNDVKIAFRWHKPAIISTHRVNYTGSLNKENRENGLHKLSKLLNKITGNWPDVEFMTTDQLGSIISGKK